MSRLLFLSRWYPDPPNNGSKLRIYHLLQGISAAHEVTLISFVDQAAPGIGRGARGRPIHQCRAVHTVPWKTYRPHSLRARLGFLSPKPRWVVDTFSPQMAQTIEQTLQANPFDAIIASQIDMAVYSPYFHGIPALFEEAELAVLHEQYAHAPSAVRRARFALMWAKYRHYLRRRLRDFEACTVVSEQERQLLAQAAPHFEPVEVIPNGVDVAEYDCFHTDTDNNDLIFCGSFTYHANYEAMVWFLSEVYPHVYRQVPDVRLKITGNHANLPLPEAENVVLTGFVDDVRPLVAQSAVSLAPIHTGGGTRLKILEAMALRTPVVATRKGAEGLDVQHGKHLLLADTPEAFAENVVCLLRDRQLQRHLSENAYQLMRACYDWSQIMPHFLQVIERVGKRHSDAVPGLK